MWNAVMLSLFPLMLSGEKLRTWGALFCASLIGSLFRYDNVAAFALIDAVAAWVILRHPRGLAQRAIGLLFVGMLSVHAGFTAAAIDTGRLAAWEYANIQRLIGWGQLLIVGVWGGSDVVRVVYHRLLRIRGRVFAHGGA